MPDLAYDKDTCPRCKGGIPNDRERGAYPGALSRYDNETYVCSGCGMDEAMWQFAHRRGGMALPPLDRPVWTAADRPVWTAAQRSV